MAKGLVERGGQFIEVIRPSIGQGVVHLVPDALVGIEFRCVRWESLQVKSRKAATEVADRFAFVRFAVVPNHDDVAAQMTKQVAQELAHFGLLDVLAVQLTIQPKPATRGTDGNRGNGGDLVVLVGVSDAGSLPARSPGTPDRRNQEEAGFVDEGEMGAQPRGVFFIRGQSRRFHSSMAASFRCSARRSGFWQLQPSEWRSRPTWSR
jgi:hypothetical protein